MELTEKGVSHSDRYETIPHVILNTTLTDSTECGKFHTSSFNSHRKCQIFMTRFSFDIRNNSCTVNILKVHFADEIATMICHSVVLPLT